MSEKTKSWLKAAAVRAVKTTAQAAVAMLPASATIAAVDWKVVLGGIGGNSLCADFLCRAARSKGRGVKKYD